MLDQWCLCEDTGNDFAFLTHLITRSIFTGKAKCDTHGPTIKNKAAKYLKISHPRFWPNVISFGATFSTNKQQKKPQLHCLQHDLGGSRKQMSKRLQKAAEMPFIKSWSVLLKLVLLASHLCILCFSYKFVSRE